jgi:hypothetical protein
MFRWCADQLRPPGKGTLSARVVLSAERKTSRLLGRDAWIGRSSVMTNDNVRASAIPTEASVRRSSVDALGAVSDPGVSDDS